MSAAIQGGEEITGLAHGLSRERQEALAANMQRVRSSSADPDTQELLLSLLGEASTVFEHTDRAAELARAAQDERYLAEPLVEDLRERSRVVGSEVTRILDPEIALLILAPPDPPVRELPQSA